ncbi:FAD/FMN-containing dehydrogenase [Halobiforma haloterrestris]|uniref:FAD/FMN-containing dehydrogenase n=1 Tax=Natronobacterium haloterrestre TaxID=148448 RepID=A0A1I1F2A5_NATHA|nr:FAD-binding oxidoreductase [Halobiforma haloterrestris]SFB91888.1 FAD/FMN-containing dehydrogenase [Halobiforma haloterrestris]
MSLDTPRVDSRTVAEFEEALRGDLLRSGDEEYDEVRTVWNAMIDRRLEMIVRCTGTADVVSAVEFAVDNDLPISVKAGGHNIAGRAVADGCLMVDLSKMNSVRVDPDAKTARVEPGVVLNELDHETQAFGLATPVGYNSTTGVAGLTLGGGWGWLSRKYGTTVDNLVSADVVTAEGELVHASEEENEDLFWGVRGGGGNFGIVTSFEFALHEVGPEVLSGPIVHPFEDTETVLKEHRELAADAPKDAAVWFVIRHAPPMPFIPEEWHGEKVIILAAFYAGEMTDGEDVLQPWRDIGDPIADAVGPHPYAGWQQAFDALGSEGARNYWKSHNFEQITDGMIETFVEYGRTIPSEETEIACAQLGGAVNEVPVEATAYPHRDAEFVMNLHTRWEDPEQDEECIAWARDMHEAMAPHATGGVYANFVPEEVGDQQAAYRENYDRMVEVKTKWDPENVFRLNHNVEPNR